MVADDRACRGRGRMRPARAGSGRAKLAHERVSTDQRSTAWQNLVLDEAAGIEDLAVFEEGGGTSSRLHSLHGPKFRAPRLHAARRHRAHLRVVPPRTRYRAHPRRARCPPPRPGRAAHPRRSVSAMDLTAHYPRTRPLPCRLTAARASRRLRLSARLAVGTRTGSAHSRPDHGRSQRQPPYRCAPMPDDLGVSRAARVPGGEPGSAGRFRPGSPRSGGTRRPRAPTTVPAPRRRVHAPACRTGRGHPGPRPADRP